MNTTSNTVYLCRDSGDSLPLNISYKNIKVILLKEEIFIKVIDVVAKSNIDNLLKENVNKTFGGYDMLIHYEVLKINKKEFLIIYFVNYYNILKSIVSKCKNVSIIPYQLGVNKGKYFSGISVIVTNFKENLYLIIKINGVVVYIKNIIEEKVDESIKLSLEFVKNEFKFNNLKIKYYIDKNIKLDECKEIVAHQSILEKR